MQETLSFQQAETVLIYASLSDEVPTLRFLQCVEKRLVLPCVISDTQLELRLYTGPEDLEVRGRYHIPEPLGERFDDYAAIDLIIVPGMAFDKEGHRLGRGKGYYDRLLAHPDLRNKKKIGLCFDFQCVDTVPWDMHDVVMDEVITIPTE